jgi:hypothetical protein
VVQYAKDNNLHDEKAFKWWVKHTLKCQDRIIKAMKSSYVKRTNKFGIRVTNTVKEALQIDHDTKTTFWHDAIKKEMTNNRSAFKFLHEDE